MSNRSAEKSPSVGAGNDEGKKCHPREFCPLLPQVNMRVAASHWRHVSSFRGTGPRLCESPSLAISADVRNLMPCAQETMMDIVEADDPGSIVYID